MSGLPPSVAQEETSHSATSRSTSVIFAARTWYSTPTGTTSCGGGHLSIRDPNIGSRAGARDRAGAVEHAVRSAAGPDRSSTGVAIGWPVGMIRHRFGGHLRAVRTKVFATLSIAPPTLIPIGRDPGGIARCRWSGRWGDLSRQGPGSGSAYGVTDRRRPIPAGAIVGGEVHEVHEGSGRCCECRTGTERLQRQHHQRPEQGHPDRGRPALPGRRQGGIRPDPQRRAPRGEGRRRSGRRVHDHRSELGGLRQRAQRRARPADRREQYDQDRGQPGLRRHRRPAQLGCRPGGDPDLERRRPAPVLAGQHDHGADQGPRGEADPDEAEQLHPGRHQRRDPGSRSSRIHHHRPQEEERLHHRRHRDLR